MLFILERIGFYSPVKNYSDFDTAMSLHLFHTVVLLTFAFKNQYIRESKIKIIYYAFVFGIVLTSFPLYAIYFIDPDKTLGDILRIIAFVGSGALVGGWVTILYVGVSYRSKNKRR